MTDKRHVVVTWLDASCDSSWQDPGTILTPTKCFTTGWLLHEDEGALMIAATMSEDGGFNQTMTIPRGMVLEMDER